MSKELENSLEQEDAGFASALRHAIVAGLPSILGGVLGGTQGLAAGATIGAQQSDKLGAKEDQLLKDKKARDLAKQKMMMDLQYKQASLDLQGERNQISAARANEQARHNREMEDQADKAAEHRGFMENMQIAEYVQKKIDIDRRLREEAKLTPDMVAHLQNISDAATSLESTKELASKVVTGPIASRVASVAGSVPVVGSGVGAERSKLEMELEVLGRKMTKTLNPGVPSDRDQAAIDRIRPNVNQHGKEIQNRLDGLNQIARRNAVSYIDALVTGNPQKAAAVEEWMQNNPKIGKMYRLGTGKYNGEEKLDRANRLQNMEAMKKELKSMAHLNTTQKQVLQAQFEKAQQEFDSIYKNER